MQHLSTTIKWGIDINVNAKAHIQLKKLMIKQNSVENIFFSKLCISNCTYIFKLIHLMVMEVSIKQLQFIAACSLVNVVYSQLKWYRPKTYSCQVPFHCMLIK